MTLIQIPKKWHMLKILFSSSYSEGGLPWWLSGKESACNAGDAGSIPGSGSSPGGGHGCPLQYSCLENPKDRGAWWATVPGVAKSWTRPKWLEYTHTHTQQRHQEAFITVSVKKSKNTHVHGIKEMLKRIIKETKLFFFFQQLGRGEVSWTSPKQDGMYIITSYLQLPQL